MFLAQLAVSMAVWAATVYALVRHREALLARMTEVPRGRRTAAALAGILSSIALLALGMGALGLGGLTPQGFTWWGWPLITLVGAGFVTLQTFALVPLVLNAVTRERSESSDREDASRP